MTAAARQLERGANWRGVSRRRVLLAAEPYLYTLPSVLLICVIMLVPLLIGLTYAFHDVPLLDPSSGDFVGLEHFRELNADPAFWNALRNTLTWTAASVTLQFGLGLVLALLLNRLFHGRAVIQLLVFLPWAIPSFCPD